MPASPLFVRFRAGSDPLGSGRRRGSTLLLVLALLALLTLMAMTLSYVSKLEVQAVANAAVRVQARMAAVTGIPVTAARLATAGATATESARVTAAESRRETSNETARSSDSRENAPQSEKGFIRNEQTGLANAQIEDQSALFNINALSLRASETLAETDTQRSFAAQADMRQTLRQQNLQNTAQNRQSSQALPQGVPVPVLERFLADRLASARLNANRAPALARAIHQYYAPREWEFETRDRKKNATRTQVAYTAALQGRSKSNRTGGNRQDFIAASAAAAPAPGRYQIFDQLSDLKRIAGLSDAEFEAIAPYLTTFSSSLDVWLAPSGETYYRAPLNEATDEQLYNALRVAFPNGDENQLRQLAVNLVDRRDADSLPTVAEAVKGSFPIIGYERTVRLSEVCGEVMCVPEDGADGQYIELHNPLDTPVNLAGWRLDWGAGSHTLTGTLPARGFLIVTNDLKNDQAKPPEENQTGMGSFYDVFRRLPNGTSEQILEVPELDLQNNSIGRVSLRDQAGHLIDYLTFRSAAFTGQNRGYRKASPFSHIGVAAPASPFADDTPKLSDPYEIFCWDILQACMDQPFHSVAEILTVPVFFAQAGAREDQNQNAFPVLDAANDTLGPRLLDCFLTSPQPNAFDAEDRLLAWRIQETDRPADAVRNTRNRVAKNVSSSDPVILENQPGLSAEELIGLETGDTLQPPISYGKINLNTASAAVLGALPGLNAERAARIVALQARAHKNAPDQAPGEAFLSLAEFACAPDIWTGANPVERLEALLHVVPLVSVNSTAFIVTSSNRDGALEETAMTPRVSREEAARASRQACRALIHQIPGLGPVVLKWQFLRTWN